MDGSMEIYKEGVSKEYETYIEKNDRKYLVHQHDPIYDDRMQKGIDIIQPYRFCNGNCNEHYTLWNKR